MIIPDSIIAFLKTASDISFGYREINFVNPDEINDAQVGYSVDWNGNSLITRQEGDWKENWLVIATDELGDPIFVDTNNSPRVVLSAPHGEGFWQPYAIAGTLNSFKKIITLLKEISKNREYPISLEENPLTDKKKKAILSEIKRKAPHTELWYWENFLKIE